MSLLACSNASMRYPVRILFFGQSITRQDWWRLVEEQLRSRYPWADLEVVNTGISGFSATQLNRTLPHCVYPYDPDLVVFHDYGGKDTGEWERMIRDIRHRSAAEILLWTDHVGKGGDEGQEARNRREDESSDLIRFTAQRYGCELVDARKQWQRHLERHRLKPDHFLKDNVHLNERGIELLAGFILEHFTFSPFAPLVPPGYGEWGGTVRSIEVMRAADDPGETSDPISFPGGPWRKSGGAGVGLTHETPLDLTFDGYRVDVIFGRRVGEVESNCVGIHDHDYGSAEILIDGRPPSADPSLYAHTLPSPAHGADWQPAIRRVAFTNRPLLEEWTMRIFDVSEDATRFSFEVEGSETGPDGTGTFDSRKYRFGRFGDILDYTGDDPYPDLFVSDSGRVVIDHRDFKITWAQQYSGEKCPEGFEIRWKTVPLFKDAIEPNPNLDPGRLDKVTVACGLSPGTHLLKIIPRGDGPVPIREIQVRRPVVRGE